MLREIGMINKRHKLMNKILYFFENWLICIVLCILAFYLTINHYFVINNIKWAHFITEDFLQTSLRTTLFKLKNSLLSIAAIFIGIYVTVFTLLGSIKVDSIFAHLNEYTFKKLVKFIRNAFIASFLYLILILFFEVYYSDYSAIPTVLIIVGVIIILYMFATAFRFGIILYFAFSKDLDNLKENIERKEAENKKIQELRFKMENFLNDYEEKQSKKKADQMSGLLKNKSKGKD